MAESYPTQHQLNDHVRCHKRSLKNVVGVCWLAAVLQSLVATGEDKVSIGWQVWEGCNWVEGCTHIELTEHD